MDHLLDAQAFFDELPDMEDATQFELALLLLEELTPLPPEALTRLRELIGDSEDRAVLLKLIRRIEQVVPYVTATLGSGNRMAVEGKPNWVQVHKGRCFSSHNQLEVLEGEAKELKERLQGPQGPRSGS